MTTQAPTRRRSRASALAWFSVLAPPLAWAAQLVIGYAFQEAGCGRPDADLWGAGLGGLTSAVIVACGVVAGLGAVAGVVAWRGSRGADPLGRIEFLAIAGVASGFIFLLAIVLSGVALIPLDPCVAG
jgi:hypothetical protein